MKNLYLFSEMFPFGNHSEIAFLQNEISYLADVFNKVTIIPYGCSEKLFDSSNSVLSLADLDLSLKRELDKNEHIARLKKSVLNRLFFKEIISRKNVLLDKKKLKRLLSYLSRAKVVEGWFKRNINSKTDQSTNLLYTFWNNEITLGLANAVQDKRNCKIISRAHAHDLYENESFIGYIPCYKEKLQRLNRIYPVSNEGSAYLNNKYPGFDNKIKTRYLGVSRAKAVCKCSADSIIRIVSSSYSIHRKRVDLLMNGIHAFSKKYHQKVIYHHFGDGMRQSELKDLASTLKSENFEVIFHGFVPNSSLLNHYAHYPVDLFINTSVSEGLPVSLQEAQAYGIPIIGTAVNGIPEIVNSGVGVLISANPSIEEIADAIHEIISDKDKFLTMRQKSIENWGKKFNAEKNYKSFADEICSLMQKA